jgi:NDP-sugar pyrophosphorylase family protein
MPSPEEMPLTAILLAGGLGTRLRSVIADRPKVLAPVAGKPFLDYVLNYLSSQGIRKVVLSLGYLAEQIQDLLSAKPSNPNIQGMLIDTVVEQTPLGTAGALKLASEGIKHPFFVLNADTLFLIDLKRLWQAYCTRPVAATIALRGVAAQDKDQTQRGRVRLLPEGRISDFDEKPQDIVICENDPGRRSSEIALINGGIYLLTLQALASVPQGTNVSIERHVFPELAVHDQLNGVVCDGYFTDIGNPGSLAAFERDVLSGKVI